MARSSKIEWYDVGEMNQPIPNVTAEDVFRVVRREFESAWVAEAERLLGLYVEKEPFRVRLAALRIAGGDMKRLSDAVALARLDYRDVLMAEYPRYGELDDGADDMVRTRAIETDWNEYHAWAGLGDGDRVQ